MRGYFNPRRFLVALRNLQDCLIGFVQIKFGPGRISRGKRGFQFLFGLFILSLIIVNNPQFTVCKIFPEMETVTPGGSFLLDSKADGFIEILYGFVIVPAIGIPSASYVVVPPLAPVKIKVPGNFFFRRAWLKIVSPVIRTNIGNRGATDKHE